MRPENGFGKGLPARTVSPFARGNRQPVLPPPSPDRLPKSFSRMLNYMGMHRCRTPHGLVWSRAKRRLNNLKLSG